MSESIAVRSNALPIGSGNDTLALLNAVLADLTALRAAHVALTLKLDADATVTDTNYGSLTNPAALTLVA